MKDITPDQEKIFADLAQESKEKVTILYCIADVREKLGLNPINEHQFEHLYAMPVGKLHMEYLNLRAYHKDLIEKAH